MCSECAQEWKAREGETIPTVGEFMGSWEAQSEIEVDEALRRHGWMLSEQGSLYVSLGRESTMLAFNNLMREHAMVMCPGWLLLLGLEVAKERGLVSAAEADLGGGSGATGT